MTATWPDLDDRRFQDFVDDAKRLVQRRCPEWSDHNVSDPGVTLIEAAAQIADQIGYRLNRVPDRLYQAFLHLLGMRTLPPGAAVTTVAFTLAAPPADPVVIPAGTEVATTRTQLDEPVVFSTDDDFTIPPCSLDHLVTSTGEGSLEDHSEDLHRQDAEIVCFADTDPESAVMFGLSAAIPSCTAVVRLDFRLTGIGVDPRQPPVVWEAWTGAVWAPCRVAEDSTLGLNRSGDVVLRLPTEHSHLTILGSRAAWIRCRMVKPRPGQPTYHMSPTIRAAEVFTIGGSVTASHSEPVRGEILGASDGTAGQRFALAREPVVRSHPMTVEVEAPGDRGWEPWTLVDHFTESKATDHHVRFLDSAGTVEFGPAIRQGDGSFRQFGAVPPAGARIRVPLYHVGGGSAGNLGRDRLTVLRSSLPSVASVTNIEPAVGGVDAETIDEAKARAPFAWRTRARAVTASDYEFLAVEASHGIARARCLAVEDAEGASTGARVLLVPHVIPDELGAISFANLVPGDDRLAETTAYLEARRPIGARFVVQPPRYRGVTVAARLRGSAHVGAMGVSTRALRALYAYLNPVTGGPDGTGWPFGRDVHRSDVFGVLQHVPGVIDLDEVLLFSADPVTRERGPVTERVELAQDVLVFSVDHQVHVEVS